MAQDTPCKMGQVRGKGTAGAKMVRVLGPWPVQGNCFGFVGLAHSPVRVRSKGQGLVVAAIVLPQGSQSFGHGGAAHREILLLKEPAELPTRRSRLLTSLARPGCVVVPGVCGHDRARLLGPITQ